MATMVEPYIDSWYKDLETNLSFKVINIEDDDNIEVQYLDGGIGAFDKESWNQSMLDFIEPPEDWSAPYDEMEDDDLGYSDLDVRRRNYDDIDSGDWLDD